MDRPLDRPLVEQRIYSIRGRKVMLDSDLAAVYGVATKHLNQAVRRNIGRFPDDFMFRLTKEEAASLRSQFVTSKIGRGGSRYLPRVFTEHGAIMLASALNSDRAIETSVMIARAFVKQREIIAAHRGLSAKLDELEAKVAGHDEKLTSAFRAIRRLMRQPKEPPVEIKQIPGFKKDD